MRKTGRKYSTPVFSKEKIPDICPGFRLYMSNRSGDLTGTHAPGTNIHMARRTVDNGLHTLHIGLPGTIGTPVRVRDLNTKGHAFAAILALSHPLHLPAVAYYVRIFISTSVIITESIEKCKKNFQKIRSFFAPSFLAGARGAFPGIFSQKRVDPRKNVCYTRIHL